MNNLCYIISDVNSSRNFEWTLLELKKDFPLSVILLNKKKEESRMKQFLSHNLIPFVEINYSGKLSLLNAVFRISAFLLRKRIGIVHCHLFEASLAGLIAAKLVFVKTRIYTRHNSTINLLYYPHAVKYDKLINKLATKIVSISDVVSEVLIKHEFVKEEKLIKIHHGFDFNEIKELAGKKNEIRLKYNIPQNQKIIGVVSRYIEYKGLQYSIPAIIDYVKENGGFIVLANASGPYKNKVSELLKSLDKSHYIEIEFEENPYALFANFDVFVHTPIHKNDEAFGQVYIEAMFLGIPVITTLTGIVNEFSSDKKYFYPVLYKNSVEIKDALVSVLNNQTALPVIGNAKTYVRDHFTLNKMSHQLNKLYSCK